MMTQQSDEHLEAPPRTGLARDIWYLAAQGATLALLVLALVWSAEPARPYQLGFALLTVVSAVTAIVPSFRRGDVAAVVAGLALAMACAMSIDRTWNAAFLASTYIPLMTPVMVGAALVLGIWGVIAKAGVLGQVALGKTALVGGLLLGCYGFFSYLLMNRVQAMQSPDLNYAFLPDQLQEIVATALLYPLAIWLGTVGVRKAVRWIVLPAGLAIVLTGFLLFWIVR